MTASGRNLRFSAAGQLLTVIFNFIMRRMLIGLLGAEYTGFSGLCGHVLNFLSLLEPGFDAACIYRLYRPLAQNGRRCICEIMAYIKKVYRTIGIITFASGLLILPFILWFSRKTVDMRFGAAVYVIMLSEMSLSFFMSHRFILPPADQKSYVNSYFGCMTFVLSRLVQLAALSATESFILYLASGLICSVLGELLLYLKVGRMYPYIKKSSPEISAETKKEINKNASSLIFRKTAAVLCGSADNLAVFAFLGLSGGTVYSNYTMLSGICLAFISVITGSVAGSIGNLGVTGGRKRVYGIYNVALFSIFTVSGIFAVSLFFIYPPLISLWVGSDMVLGTGTTALFCICMLVSAARRPGCVFLDALGLFEKEKFKAPAEAFITVVMTLILTPVLGISGVLLGQLCASLFFSLPCEVYILFRHGFGESVLIFCRDLAKYIFALFLTFTLSLILCSCTGRSAEGITLILIRAAICIISGAAVFFILFFDSDRLSQAVKYARKMAAGTR